MHSRARRLGSFALGVFAFLAAAAAFGATAVPQWQQIFHPAANGTTTTPPLAARELADGTVLIVTKGFQTVHYNHDGTIVSVKQLNLDPPERPAGPRGRSSAGGPDVQLTDLVHAQAAIDGFGRVAIAVVALQGVFPPDSGNIQTSKFDGLTGEPLWPAPQFYQPGPGLGAYPTAVFLDEHGDVIVTGLFTQPQHVTLKYEGTTGALMWGPIVLMGLSNPDWTSTSAVDPAGNVYVSVSTPDPAILTVKYSGDTGSGLGSLTFTTGDPVFHFPQASAIDPEGHYAFTAIAGGRFVTVKLSDFPLLDWSSAFTLPAGAFNAAPQSLVADASGNFFVSGRYDLPGGVSRYTTQKLSGASGTPLWTAAPIDATPGYQPSQGTLASNGDLVFAGALGPNNDSQLNFWRYRGADGTVVWGPLAFAPINGYDPARFFVGSNGRIFTTVLSNGLQSGEIDATIGVIAWGPTAATFPLVDVARLEGLASGPDGDPVVTGYTGFGNYQAVTLKYDRATGNLLWGPVVYAPPDAVTTPLEVAVDASNDVFVLGFNENLNPPGYQAYLIKYSGLTGAVLWGPVFFDDVVEMELGIDASGDVVLIGATIDPIGPQHIEVDKVAGANGAIIWGPVVFESGPSNSDAPQRLTLDASGNALVTGFTFANGEYSWLALKYAGSNGSLLWGPSSGTLGIPYSAAVDASGNLVVSGNNQQAQMTTIKYAGVNGAILWGPVHTSGVGGAVAVAPNGDVVASGDVLNPSGTNVDFSTVRYQGSDGSVVWGPVVTDGPGGGNDVPLLGSGVAFDSSGNVVLGGTSQTFIRNNDIALVKYAGTSGATLWGPVFVGGPDNESLGGLDVRGDSIVVGGESELGILTAMLDESLGIETTGPALPPAFCGIPYHFDFVARNGSPGYTWTLVSGTLPNGMSLSGAGFVAGMPTEQGSFTFTVRVTDSTAAFAERDFVLLVTENSFGAFIVAAPAPTCHSILSVSSGFWSSYLWLPNGETTPTIDVAPIETTTYGVIVTDSSGACLLHLAISLPGIALQNPSCLGPSVSSISPSSGPASGGTPVTITGGNFELGLELEIGGQSVGSGYVDEAHLNSTTPALPPGTLNDVVVQNPDSGNAALLHGFFADFLDVPPANIFHTSIERLFRRGVTAGCDVGLFCPDSNTTRAQMAVFLLKSLLGTSYVPPPATGGLFDDVLLDTFAAAWIEDLYNRGITGGCLTDPLRYCPDANVSRAEMAVFLLKTLLGNAYVPPTATGTIFADVSVDTFGAAWIEDLYNRGITAGCLTGPLRYCPDAPVTRGEMAAFLVLTFSL